MQLALYGGRLLFKLSLTVMAEIMVTSRLLGLNSNSITKRNAWKIVGDVKKENRARIC